MSTTDIHCPHEARKEREGKGKGEKEEARSGGNRERLTERSEMTH